MRTLAFDGSTGASGDMLLGALVDAGGDPDVLAELSDHLPVTYEIREVDRNGILATKVDVVHDDAPTDDDSGARDHDHHEPDHGTDHHEPDHGTDHHEPDHATDHHEPVHGHDHQHDHAVDGSDGRGAEGHGPSRSYEAVVDLVDGLRLSDRVREDALGVFELLGEAEASVHGVELSATHFHEVGADDAIADVVGACALFADLDVDRVVTTPVATGGGTVEMAHGTYPIPAPAVVELAASADWAVTGGPIETELLTPTGAALLAHFADGVDALPSMDVDGSGYGAGSKSFEDYPNVLRATVGDADGGLRREDVAVLETTLDDATPEVLGGLHDALADAGALDVTVVGTTGKKSRPGHVVTVVCAPADADAVARRLAVETGTLGVRATGVSHRWVADRTFETVSIEVDDRNYDVDVKVASDTDGRVYDVSTEYDDAARIARDADVPTRDVIRRAETAYHDAQ